MEEYFCPFIFKQQENAAWKSFHVDLSEISSRVLTEPSRGPYLDPGPPFGDGALDFYWQTAVVLLISWLCIQLQESCLQVASSTFPSVVLWSETSWSRLLGCLNTHLLLLLLLLLNHVQFSWIYLRGTPAVMKQLFQLRVWIFCSKETSVLDFCP